METVNVNSPVVQEQVCWLFSNFNGNKNSQFTM